MNQRQTSLIAILLAVLSSPGLAQALTPAEVADLRAQLEQLRAEQARAAERISAIEAAINGRSSVPATANSGAVQGTKASKTATVLDSEPVDRPARNLLTGLDISADLRIRHEHNFGDSDAPNRNRLGLRARFRASYAVRDWLTVGTQIVTGDPDDPNSTDATLSSFADDLEISLDQAWLRATFGRLELYGGKMPQPFLRTEMVWDGDVSPQGSAAVYRLALGSDITLRAAGLYFAIDEDMVGPDSNMVGGQIAIETDPEAPFALELAAGYYDYSLRTSVGADETDIRTNRFADGRYLSDFDLLDLLAAVSWKGLGEKWPVRLSGDYVHNFGAPNGIDTGYAIDLLVGRTAQRGDFRFGYGYASVDTDAVLAAFSQDNSTIATNYLQHSLTLDYMPAADVVFNATLYRFRPKRAIDAGTNDPGDWLNRLRLQMVVGF